MLVGRTRTGKSSIKSLLIDPTTVPDEIMLRSGIRDPLFESFHARENDMMLKIIDTPGLFERGIGEISIRDSDTIMRTFDMCANMGITKFHMICFCIALSAGINTEDIKSLELLIEFLGRGLANNSCLIITHCESKTEEQRAALRNELTQDSFFKSIAPFFELGIFFTGSLNRDDYNKGNESILDQFITICDYRERLIQLFSCNTIEPFPVCEMIINRMSTNNDSMFQKQLEKTNQRYEEQQRIINELTNMRVKNQAEIKDLMQHYRQLIIQEEKAKAEAVNYENLLAQLLRNSKKM